jgi:hypothetical protein
LDATLLFSCSDALPAESLVVGVHQVMWVEQKPHVSVVAGI